jgi:hypothetical protein
MALLTKVDISFRAKLQHISEVIRNAKARLKSATKKFEKTNQVLETEEIEKKIEALIESREEMKREYELAKLKQSTLQIDEILSKEKGFMQMVKKAKTEVIRFEEITAVRPPKKPKNSKIFRDIN